MTSKTSSKAIAAGMASLLAVTTISAAEAKPRPKTTAASAAKAKPNADARRTPGQRAGTTRGSAARDSARPNTSRNRVGYINPPMARQPRQVTFKMPTRSQRTAASTLRRTARGNAVALGSSVRDRRSPNAQAALNAKQSSRGKPRVRGSSTTALKNAVTTGRRTTAASRGAERAGAAPVGTGQVPRQWSTLAAQTAQRRGLPPQSDPGVFRRIVRGAKGMLRRSK